MAPAGTLGVIIPLLVGKAGNGTWLVLLLIMAAYGLILLCINQFAGAVSPPAPSLLMRN